MDQENYILVKTYCERTKIENSFLSDLHDYGIIELKKIKTELYILDDDIPEIERVSRIHYDLGINLEGIDALNHMLMRLQHMENEMKTLRRRLQVYEK